MVVRLLAVMLALGLGWSLAGCGSTRKETKPGSPAACTAENCPDDCCDAAGAGGGGAGSGSGGAPTVSCTPEVRQCAQGQVLICGKDGASLRLYDNCEAGEVCDEQTLACGPVVCQPGAPGCFGTKVTECSASGTAQVETGQDCLSDGQGCEDGKCVDLVCTPLAKSCTGNDVYQCDAAGLHDVVVESCGVYAHCVFVAPTGAAVSNAHCTQNTCQPGSQVCAGNAVKVCTDEGTLPAEVEADCGDDVCVNGACAPKICEPLERLCLYDDVHECVSPGAGTQLAESCPEGSRCATLGSGVACKPFLCESGATACLGNVVGTCAADGESLAQVTQDCASTQQVCNATPTCVASVVDTLGVAENVDSFSSNEVFGNIIDVHSNRQLTKLEAHLVLEGPRDLRWVVYELTNEGFYSLKASEITSNNTGSALFGSTDLAWQLEAGKRYLLGVGLVVFEGYGYYDEAPYDSTVSFGTVVGGTRNAYDMTMFFDVNAPLYRIRVTTELP